MVYLIDSHCHLQDVVAPRRTDAAPLPPKGPERQRVLLKEALARARRCGVTHFLSIACTPQEFAPLYEAAAPESNVFFACGMHPLNLKDQPDWSEDELRACLRRERVLALGETGLDYHYSSDNRREQLDSFARQIALARELKLPMVIHAREAGDDTLALFKSENARDAGGVLHCFTDSVAMARACLDLGFYISFTGIATFDASENVREVIRYVPQDRLMVETDCPYLAPVPVRGKRNEPAFVRYTLNYLAAMLKLSPAKLAALTSDNFARLFKVRLADPPAEQLSWPCADSKLETLIDKPL